MQELPQIFDGTRFIEPDATALAALSPDAIARLDAIRTAYAAVTVAEQNEATAKAEIADAVEQVAAAEKACAPYGEYTFQRLWEQTIKRK
ncbi:MAG: hypothetical protein ACRECV_02075 [Xanthobacteraceae bacterium]